LVCAIALTIALLWASFLPTVGQTFGGDHHLSAHLISFAILALAWTWALTRAHTSIVALFVIGFGFLQEGIEIFGHGHPFEINDVVIDALGAIIGVMLAYVSKRIVSIKQPL
jgi:VanZ family protein